MTRTTSLFPAPTQEELDNLPPYLKDGDQVLEMEHIPLQLSLLTMEIAQQHLLIRQLINLISEMRADADARTTSP